MWTSFEARLDENEQERPIPLRRALFDVLRGSGLRPGEGVTKKIKIRRLEPCKTCDGAGGKGRKTCGTCGGMGQVKQVSQSLFGQMINVVSCPKCDGTGHSFDEACRTCQGSGLDRQEVTISVQIPAGVAEGNYLTLRGEGVPTKEIARLAGITTRRVNQILAGEPR